MPRRVAHDELSRVMAGVESGRGGARQLLPILRRPSMTTRGDAWRRRGADAECRHGLSGLDIRETAEALFQ
jgi:hypothetical protein